MNIDKSYRNLKQKTKEMVPLIKDSKGRYLFIAFILVLILLFFAPLFQAPVGTTIIGCVAAPYVVLVWRRFDKKHASTAVFYLSVAMILSSIIYLAAGDTQQKYTALFYVVAIISMYFISTSKRFTFYDKMKDTVTAYIVALIICVAIVIVANLIVFLFSIAWWIICLIAFLALIIAFFAFVFGSAAYTATDDARQKNKRDRMRRERELDDEVIFDPVNNTYNVDDDDIL